MKEEKKHDTEDQITENNLDAIDNLGFTELMAEPIEEPDGTKYVPWQCFISDITTQEGTVIGHNYAVYLYAEILDPSVYSEILHILRCLRAEDAIDLYINSNGGDLSTMISFLTVLESTRAFVTTHVDGSAASAAAILAFASENVDVGEYSSLMWHNIQNFMMGSNDNAKQILSNRHFGKVYEKMLRKFCSRVLTYTEIDDIINKGIEVWLTSDEVKQRLRISSSETNCKEN